MIGSSQPNAQEWQSCIRGVAKVGCRCASFVTLALSAVKNQHPFCSVPRYLERSPAAARPFELSLAMTKEAAALCLVWRPGAWQTHTAGPRHVQQKRRCCLQHSARKNAPHRTAPATSRSMGGVLKHYALCTLRPAGYPKAKDSNLFQTF